jgi:5-methyltetrahydrofolate--homocysteine methyltransferase
MQPDHTAELTRLLGERILVLDGAMGTMIQQCRLGEREFRGPFHDHPRDLAGDNDLLSLTQPQTIATIHDAYFEAGADLVETNTFNATRIAQADYGMESEVRAINEAAARIARESADRWTRRTVACCWRTTAVTLSAAWRCARWQAAKTRRGRSSVFICARSRAAAASAASLPWR